MKNKDLLKIVRIAQTAIVVVLFIALTSFIWGYRKHTHQEIETAVNEHAGLMVEPLWNIDLKIIEVFLSRLAARPEYKSIKLFDQEEVLVYESQASHLKGVDRVLFGLNLIQIKKETAEVDRFGQGLGKIEVFWWDRSIYMSANSCLVAVLLSVITVLYGAVVSSNSQLKGKVTALHDALEKVKGQKEFIENIFHVVPEGLVTTDNERQVVAWNYSFDRIVGSWAKRLGRDRQEIHELFIKRLMEEVCSKDAGEYRINIDAEIIDISYSSSMVADVEGIERVVSVIDATEMLVMQQRLSQAEKLESVGRLAAGIAHEINTPTQYVISNVDFFSEAFSDLASAMAEVSDLADEVSNESGDDLSSSMKNILEDADWEYLKEEIPEALRQSIEGLRRIQTIVSAMKQFSHPSGDVAEQSDLNEAIRTTITVATNEWKYCADLDMELAEDLPEIPCYRDQLNQVILNMIVNSAHAIEEKFAGTEDGRGKIVISTQRNGEFVQLTIADNGVGMSDEVQLRIFDPFFTTKAVNKGSGQGLAIANDIIVNKHNGIIEVDSEVGKGTTFLIRLPLNLATV